MKIHGFNDTKTCESSRKDTRAMSHSIEEILARKYQMDDFGRICTIGDLFTTFSPNVDLEALAKTDFFPALERMMEPVLNTNAPGEELQMPDEHGEENIAYWASKGMIKEFQGQDKPIDWDEYAKKTGYRWNAEKWNIPQNAHNQYTAFLPASARLPENKDRRYPLLIALHGATNNQFLLEGWGFVEEGAKREWIVVIPSMEVDDFILDVIRDVCEKYPVDPSRIYAAGFSYGGWASNRLGNQYPEIFAAVAPCGAPMDNAWIAGDTEDREPLPPFDGNPRAQQLGICMPILNCYGEKDGERFPFYNFHGRRFGLSTMETPADLVAGVNSWLKSNNAPLIDIKDVEALKARVEAGEAVTLAQKEVGLPVPPECAKSYIADGVQYHLVSFPSADGVARVKILAEMNIPHWPTPEMIRQIFEFFSHFRRDPETKKSIYAD